MRKKTTNLTKISSWNGIPVSVDQEGRFYAKIDDIEITADTLTTVRTKIDAALKPSAKKAPISLPVIVILDDEKIVTTTVTGISRANRTFQFDPPLPATEHRYRMRILADTPANQERAKAHVEAEAAVTKTRDVVNARHLGISGYGRIEIEQYEGIAAKLVADHKKSAK